MQLSDKDEIVLKEMCWDDAYLIIGMEYSYVGNYNNNTTHIYIVSVHVGMVDINTFYPCPCQILLHIYDVHAESQSFYMYQIGN